MKSSLGRRLVVGPGGTGRTHQLQSWVEELDAEERVPVTWITAHYARPLMAATVTAALGRDPRVLVLDDLQWFADEALDAVAEAIETSESANLAFWASRRPWPTSGALQAVSDLLTERAAAVRTGVLGTEEFAQIVSSFEEGTSSTKALGALHQATGGSVGLAADAVATGWDPDLAKMPRDLVEAVTNRIRRCGPAAESLVQVLAVAPQLPLEDLIDALEQHIDREDAERAVRAGGVLDESDSLPPIVRSAAMTDLSSVGRARVHDRLAVALIDRYPDHAVRSVLSGRGQLPGFEDVLIGEAQRLQRSDPERAIDLAEHGLACGFDRTTLALVRLRASFERGAQEARGHLDDVADDTSGRAAMVGFGLDVRDLRWVSASRRPATPGIQEVLGRLISAVRGDVAGDDVDGVQEDPGTDSRGAFDGEDAGGADHRLVAALVSGISSAANGSVHRALAGLAETADDFDRFGADIPLGITPHALGAAVALGCGDLKAADSLLEQALSATSGGEGEQTTHRLMHAYTSLRGGTYGLALAAVREGEQQGWSLRDRFLLAAIDAAIARRSGDTARLRKAWTQADPVLVRTSASWIFADFAIELLAAGARLGETERVQPIAAELDAQLRGLPSAGAGAVSAHWLDLQLALAGDNREPVFVACDALAACAATDSLSLARIRAGASWAAVKNNAVDDAVLTETAQLLDAVGDGWEASRLLGQAALDHPDPAVARRLLEDARARATDPSEAGGSGLMALGLSKREAEVAVLVAAGRTYKEVGAQLYVSPKTVEHHVAHIRRKIGASSRAEFLAAIRAATDANG